MRKFITLAALSTVANASIIPNANILERASEVVDVNALSSCFRNECSTYISKIYDCGSNFRCACDASDLMTDECASCMDNAGRSSDKAKEAVCYAAEGKDIPSSLTDAVPTMTNSISQSRPTEDSESDDDDSSSQAIVPSLVLATSALILTVAIGV